MVLTRMIVFLFFLLGPKSSTAVALLSCLFSRETLQYVASGVKSRELSESKRRGEQTA